MKTSRLLIIIFPFGLLRAKERFDAPKVAARLEVSRKTSDRLGYTIDFSDGTFNGHPPKRRIL